VITLLDSKRKDNPPREEKNPNLRNKGKLRELSSQKQKSKGHGGEKRAHTPHSKNMSTGKKTKNNQGGSLGTRR